MKKFISTLLFAGLLSTAALAGPEDWTGTLTISDLTGGQTSIQHTPKYIRWGFIQAGKCISLSKGSSLTMGSQTGGKDFHIIMQADAQWCTAQSIEQLTQQIEIAGAKVIAKDVQRGSTYSVN